ncbi:MAG: hypothetical protein P8Y53_17975 [Pseudolabrys sp.]
MSAAPASSLMVRVGLGGREHAFLEIEIALVDPQHVGGDGARLLHHLFRGHEKGRTRQGGRARAAGAFAVEHLVGVALDVLHLARVETEPVAHDLLERGLVPLALAVGAGEHGDAAVALEAHFGAFQAGRASALDGVGQAEAQQLAALSRLRLALLEALAVGQGEREVHVLLELAGVVGEGEAGLERHL